MVVVVIVVVLLLLLMLSPLLRSSSFNHLIDAFYAFINNNVIICIDQYCFYLLFISSTLRSVCFEVTGGSGGGNTI